MKRLAFALFGLAAAAFSTGCCCLGGGGACGHGGGAFYGPNPGFAPGVAPGGCPNGNCGIGAAAPAYGISQAAFVPTSGTASVASTAPTFSPTSATVTAQPISGPVIMQAGGFTSGPQFTQTAGVRMNALPTY